MIFLSSSEETSSISALISSAGRPASSPLASSTASSPLASLTASSSETSTSSLTVTGKVLPSNSNSVLPSSLAFLAAAANALPSTTSLAPSAPSSDGTSWSAASMIFLSSSELISFISALISSAGRPASSSTIRLELIVSAM